MQRRIYIVLFSLGLIVAFSSAYLQASPGYMDAYYYFAGGVSLANGSGFTEMFLWNFLDDPMGLPHAGFSYWMPLTSFVAAVGIKLFSGFWGIFKGAQASFIFIAACIPPLTAALSWEFTKERKFALFSGLLAAFMGYYQPFVVAIDAFGIYMLLGGLFFLAAIKDWPQKYLLLGVFAGIMHLTRADGLLWLGMGGLVLLLEQRPLERQKFIQVVFNTKVVKDGLSVLVGYLVILIPWFVRNYLEFGSLLSPGGSKTIWVLDYDELFAYPAEMLTFSRWWASGIPNLISTRFEALFINLQSTAASLGMIFPGVLAILGIFHHRKEKLVQLGLSYWLLLIFVMTAIFPFAGIRGGFFHSAAALMPLIWVMIPLGIEVLTGWSVKTFKWEIWKIKPFYIGLLFLYVIIFSFGLLYSNIIGTEPATQPIWDLTMRQYLAVEDVLRNCQLM